jgi:hypothetical protein
MRFGVVLAGRDLRDRLSLTTQWAPAFQILAPQVDAETQSLHDR